MNSCIKVWLLGLVVIFTATFAKASEEAEALNLIKSIKIENDAELSKKVNRQQAKALGAMIVANGYRCNSITSVFPFIRSEGYTVRCNNYRYTYEIADIGGNWEVTVK